MTRGAELMRLYRRTRGLTQQELGRLLGVRRRCSAEQVCSWETGRTRPRRYVRLVLARLSAGLVSLGSWELPAEVIPATAQTHLDDLLTTGSQR